MLLFFCKVDDQPSQSPSSRKLIYELLPIIKWSSKSIPINSPHFINRLVKVISACEGWGLPLGWD
nr:MAG TPA: hypothetical protein [Caudoviricetes sp.]